MFKPLKVIFKILKLSLLHIVWILLGFSFRNRRIWVLGSGKRFGGNSRWLYTYLQTQKNIRPIWLTSNSKIVEELRKKGWESYRLYSFKGIYYALRAGIYLFNINVHDDINYFLSRGVKKINLWHGIPVKKGGYDVDLKGNYFYELYQGSGWKKVKQYFQHPWEYDVCDLVVATSEKTKKLMEGIFGPRARRVEALGYPCQDTIAGDLNSCLSLEKQIVDIFKGLKTKGEGIVLYMPTYRDMCVHENKEMKVGIDWKRLDEFLETINTVFFLKLHPIDRSDYSFLASLKRIKLIDPSVEVYMLFQYTDVLVTDYSSVFYDFLMTEQPIVFYCYDLEEYVMKNRTLYPDFFDSLPGPMVKDFETLINILKDIKEGRFKFDCAKTLQIKKEVIGFTDGKSSQRIKEYLIRNFV